MIIVQTLPWILSAETFSIFFCSYCPHHLCVTLNRLLVDFHCYLIWSVLVYDWEGRTFEDSDRLFKPLNYIWINFSFWEINGFWLRDFYQNHWSNCDSSKAWIFAYDNDTIVVLLIWEDPEAHRLKMLDT